MRSASARSGVTAGLSSRLSRSWSSIAYATCSRDAGRERRRSSRRDNAHLRKAEPPSSRAMHPPCRSRQLPSGRRRAQPPGHRPHPRCGRGHQLQPPLCGSQLPIPWMSTSTGWMRRSRILGRRRRPNPTTARSTTAEIKSSTAKSRADRRSWARSSRTGIWIRPRPTIPHRRRPISPPQRIPIARPLPRRSHELHRSDPRHQSDRPQPRRQPHQADRRHPHHPRHRSDQPQPRHQPDQSN